MAYEALAVRDDCQIRWWGPLGKLPRCREKPTRHSQQIPQTGRLVGCTLNSRMILIFVLTCSWYAEFRIGAAECTKFGVFSE
jgi:hypothetical protein